MKYIVRALVLGLVCLGSIVPDASAAPMKEDTILLPAPVKTGGKPLMEALAARSSNRQFSEKTIDDQTLSDLLWATWGVTRQDGKRTAPTAKNKQEIRLYAALENGVWLYDGEKNELLRVLVKDTRATFGGAPVTLLFAGPRNDKFSGMHAGSLYQNAGLYCASVGLANVVKGTGADALKDSLPLPDGYEVLIIQSIGWPR